MKLRRMLITKEQGELISLALVVLVNEMDKKPDAYDTIKWQLMQQQARNLKKTLDNYNWIKE